MKRFLCWWTMENDGKLPLVIVGLASNHQQSKGIGGILEDSNSAKVAIWTISIQLSVRFWSRNSNSERSIQIFLRKTIAAQLTQTKILFSAFLSLSQHCQVDNVNAQKRQPPYAIGARNGFISLIAPIVWWDGLLTTFAWLMRQSPSLLN